MESWSGGGSGTASVGPQSGSVFSPLPRWSSLHLVLGECHSNTCTELNKLLLAEVLTPEGMEGVGSGSGHPAGAVPVSSLPSLPDGQVPEGHPGELGPGQGSGRGARGEEGVSRLAEASR